MSETEQEEELKARFREVVAQQGRMLKVPTALEAVRQHCIAHVIEAMESFLLSWEQQQHASTELPSGLVRDAFSVIMSAVGPGDARLRETLLSLLVDVQSTDGRQVLLDFLPSTMPLGKDGLEEATNEVLEALEVVLTKDWTAIMPVLGCLSILPFDDKGRQQVLNLALTNLSVVAEPELPILVRTLLRHISTEEDARHALEALRTEMLVWESSKMDEPNDEGALALVIHIVLLSFQDLKNGDIVKSAYLKLIQEIVQVLSDRIEEGLGIGDDDDDNHCRLGILDTAALLLLREDPILSVASEVAIDNLMRMNCFSFESLLSVLNFTFDRKRRKPSLLHENLLGSSLVSFSFFALLLPVRVAAISDLNPVMQHIQDFVELLYNRLDMQRQRELVLGFIQLSDESSFYIQKDNKRLRKRTRSSERRMDGMNRTIANVHSVFQRLAKLDRATLIRFKEILMERLTSASTESLNKSSQKSIQQLCTTLTSMVEPVHAEPGGGRGIDSSEMLIFLQKLLFTSSQCLHSQSVQDYGSDVGRTIRGILLATELVKSPALSHGDKDCIQKWVLRILLPSTRRMVDPEIGWPGLCFLEAFSKDRTTTPQSSTELFSNLKMILANTGLIQILAQYQQRKKTNSGTVLGYSRIPSFFHIDADASTQRKKREMVFCLSIFMRHIDSTNPLRWDCAIRWVFDLVNKYLRIGRELSSQTTCSSPGSGKSKWMPHGWLQAAVELPTLDFTCKKRAMRPKIEGTMAWIRSKLCSHELSYDEHLCNSVDGDIGDILVEGKTNAQLRALCGTLSRMALAILMSLGVSAAVLENTFEHYKIETALLMPEEETGNIDVQQQSLLRLLQYQLYKIYDLKEKCEIVQRLLCVCGASMRRYKSGTKLIGKRGNRRIRYEEDGSTVSRKENVLSCNRNEDANGAEVANQMATDCDKAACKTIAIITSLFSSEDFINPIILWECLSDREHDAFINQMVSARNGRRSKGDDEGFRHLVWIRECIMNHICLTDTAPTREYDVSTLADRLASPEMNRAVTSATVVDFANCFQQASKLLAIIPQLRKNKSSREEDIRLMVASYFRVIVRVLEFTRVHQANSDSQESCSKPTKLRNSKSVTYRECLEVCSEGMKSEAIHVELTNVPDNPPLTEIAPSKTILSYLRVCVDADTAFQLMEILCIFAHRRKRELIDSALDASWKDLHTVYSKPLSGGQVTQIPLAFIDALRRFQQTSPQRKQTSERVLVATIVRAALNQTREYSRNSCLRHATLRHWGLISLSLEKSGLRHFNHITKLIAGLRSYLNAINEVQGDDFADIIANDANGATSNDSTVSSIPALTGASFAIYFELMMYFVVAMFAVSPPSVVSFSDGPYQHVHLLMQHFSLLIDLYRANIKLFPRRLFPIFLGCCKHLLNLITHQLRNCVDWRNSRPLLSVQQKSAGVEDVGSIRYMHNLLEMLATHISDSVLSFCNFIKTESSLNARRYESDDSASSGIADDKDISWIFTSHHKKIIALLSSAENALLFLREVAANHNLVLSIQPALKGNSLLLTDGNNGTLNQVDVGFHQMDSFDARPKKRLRCSTEKQDIHNESDWNCVESDESSVWSEDAESAKGSTASFGVAGNWGDDSDSDDSTVSLNLEVMETS